jgi:L-amino acid N-acyltransferase YncA
LLSGLIKGSESAGFWTLLAGIFPETRPVLLYIAARDSGKSAAGKKWVK